MSRTAWICHDDCAVLLRLLSPANALAMETALDTGLRISDVLSIKTAQLVSQRVTVREKKTGKTRRVYLPRSLLDRLKASAGSLYVFEGRDDPAKHRTRQAVYKDVVRRGYLPQVWLGYLPKNPRTRQTGNNTNISCFRASGLILFCSVGKLSFTSIQSLCMVKNYVKQVEFTFSGKTTYCLFQDKGV